MKRVFYNKVENQFKLLNKERIIMDVSTILCISDKLIEEDKIYINDDIKAFGQHKDGKVSIGINYIAMNLDNNLLKLGSSENIESFLSYFIEAILVHELQHLYVSELIDEINKLKTEIQYIEPPQINALRLDDGKEIINSIFV